MHEVDPNVIKSLWDRIRGTIEQPLSLFIIRPGMKAGRGRTKTEATYDACLEVAREAFASGVRQGYDMGMTIAKGGD